MVCFEGLFPDIALRQRLNGATWLWVPGIHDWFAGSTALMQLRQAGVWRAAEGRCPIAQSTPTGLTFVANLGVTEDLPVTRAGLIVADIRPTTPSLEWLRAIFPVVAFFVALGALFWRPKATYGNIGDEL
jgi:apolipoprotein N-acyltransferase